MRSRKQIEESLLPQIISVKKNEEGKAVAIATTPAPQKIENVILEVLLDIRSLIKRQVGIYSEEELRGKE